MIQPGAQKNKGIALLMTVVISFIVIAIGLSLSNIALRELDISITVREGMRATYAADAGIECARYWSTKNANYFSVERPDGDFRTIDCGGTTINLRSAWQNGGSNKASYDNLVMPVNGSEALITVTRERDNDERTARLVSAGYNRIVGNRQVTAFREYQIDDSLAYGGAKDIMFAMDISNSIDNDQQRNGPPEPCDSGNGLDCAIEAIANSIDKLLGPDSDRITGFVAFDEGGRCVDVGTFFTSADRSTCLIQDERIDVPMTSDKDLFVGSGGILTSEENFRHNNYRRGWLTDGSNFHFGSVFSLAELRGQKVVSRSDLGCLESSCPDDSFPEYQTLPDLIPDGIDGNGRDRPDDEYPDAFVLVGDFRVNGYHRHDWAIGFNTGNSRQFLAKTLKQMELEGIAIYLVIVDSTLNNDQTKHSFKWIDQVVVDPTDSSGFSFYTNSDYQTKPGVGVQYKLYNAVTSKDLPNVLAGDLLNDLLGVAVVPIIEK